MKSRDSFDFIVNLPNAEIETIDPDEVRIARFYIQGEGRYVLFEPSPGKITRKLKIPEQASSAFVMGIDPAAWSKEGDGVLFELLLIDDRFQKHKLFSKYIDRVFSLLPVLQMIGDMIGLPWSEPRIVWEKGEAM